VGGSDAAISPVEDVLGQLDWLTAELEAQKPFLSRIPDVQLMAQPMTDQPSLFGLYQAMLEREQAHVEQVGRPAENIRPPASMDALLVAIISLRHTLLAHLRTQPEASWAQEAPGQTEGTLLEWAYAITLDDGETLRAIAERLHESQLSMRGRQSDGL